MNRPRISLVAAVARNGVIGNKGALPWGTLPEDMAHFRALTMGSTVVMGRRTWESLPNAHRPLHGRHNVVVSRSLPEDGAPGAAVVRSLQEVIAELPDVPVIYVIGGAQLYAEAAVFADELVLTEIDRNYEGDTLFPPWKRWRFDVVDKQEQRATATTPRFSIVTYRRQQRHWSDAIHWRPGRWDDLSTAPKDCTMVRGLDAAGKVLEPMHYACDHSGEDQPYFDGWFLPYKDGSGFYQVRPVAWQPLRALPDGPDCAACGKAWADCCGRAA